MPVATNLCLQADLGDCVEMLMLDRKDGQSLAKKKRTKTKSDTQQDNYVPRGIFYVVAHHVAQLVRGTTIESSPDATNIC